MSEPKKIKRPERVKSPEFADALRLSREHPCPECHGIRKPCSTCHGTRIDPEYAVFDEEESGTQS